MIKKKLAHWHRWQKKSTNRRIFSGMLVIAVLTVLVKAVVSTKELVIAGYFGTGNVVDAFLVAFLLPSFTINVLAGAFHAAIMPTYIRTRENSGKEAANKLFSSLIVVAMLLLFVSAVALALVGPSVLALLGTGFNKPTMALTQHLFYWLLPVIVVTGACHLIATIINAGERFFIVALTPVITPICTIITLLVFVDIWGVYSLVVGILSGAGIELFVLIIAAVHTDIHILPKWSGMTKELQTVIGQYTPMLAGAFLMSSTGLVDQSMAAMLEPGSVAALNYANKVVAMILGIGSMALGTVVLPHFSRLVASEDWVGLRHAFRTYSKLIVAITLPMTILLFMLSEPIIKLLFERGAFTAQDTIQVAKTQACYILQLPFYTLGILGVRLISALTRNKILMKIAILSLPLNIIFNYIFIQKIGLAGIALSTTFVYFISMTLIYVFLFMEFKKGDYEIIKRTATSV